MTTKKPLTPKRLAVFAVILMVELAFATFAWRDLRNRTADQVRGSKRVWHIAILANPGNSIAYWLIGRKTSAVSSLS
jgi:membrane-anchored protein YejM (alkaline phosphatase superfamily)